MKYSYPLFLHHHLCTKIPFFHPPTLHQKPQMVQSRTPQPEPRKHCSSELCSQCSCSMHLFKPISTSNNTRARRPYSPTLNCNETARWAPVPVSFTRRSLAATDGAELPSRFLHAAKGEPSPKLEQYDEKAGSVGLDPNS